MLNLVLKALIFLSCTCSNTSFNVDTPKDPMLQIDFQDFFQKDRIALKVSDCTIIQDSAVTSDRSDGFTGLSIRIYQTDAAAITVKYLQQEVKCKSSCKYSGTFSITVILNGIPSRYQVDPSKGKYIGFSKKNQHELYFRQATSRFLYD
jgi:hypothetical protein